MPEEEITYPNFELAQLKAAYERNKDPKTLEKIMTFIRKDKMLFFYKDYMIPKWGLKADNALIDSF